MNRSTQTSLAIHKVLKEFKRAFSIAIQSSCANTDESDIWNAMKSRKSLASSLSKRRSKLR